MSDMAIAGVAAIFVLSCASSSLSISFGKAAETRRNTPPAPATSRPPIREIVAEKKTSPPYAPSKTSGQGSSSLGDPSLPSATAKIPTVSARPVADKTTVYTARASYYGPDKIHGIHGGNDNIFERVPASQYTASQLREIGDYFCAMTEKFMRQGFMGSIIRVTGTKKTLDLVVVDLLPDRHDGRSVEIDVHDMSVWEALGGDENVGMQTVKFRVVGKASIPVPDNSPWKPSNFGF